MELWGDEPVIESTEHVSVGGRRALGTRGRALAALAAVVGLLVAGLALGDRSSDESGSPREERDNRDRSELKTTTTTTTRPATSTTTTTNLPLGPVFGEPVGASLLLMTGGGNRATLVDLDTGVRAEVRIQADDPYGAVPVRGGVVVVRQRTAELTTLPAGVPGPEGALLGGAPVPLGDADQVLSSGTPDSVWLVQSPDSVLSGGLRAQLVDLDGNPLTGVVEVPSDWAWGASEDGVVFGIGGRVYLAGEAGVRSLAVGEVIAVAGRRLVLITCDDGASCALDVLDLANGRSRRLPVPFEDHFRSMVVLADDGRVALLQGLTLFDARGQVVASGPPQLMQGEPVWLPGDLGLVVMSDRLRRIFARDGGLVDEPIPALDGVRADFVYVIPH